VGQAGIDQLDWNTSFQGDETIMLHWVPNNDDLNFATDGTATSVTTTTSALVAYVAVSAGSAPSITYRLDYLVSYEYIPTATYKPYVTRIATSSLPDANHYAAMTTTEWFSPLVVGTLGEYSSVVNPWKPSPGFNTIHELGNHTYSGITSIGTGPTAAAVDVEAAQQETQEVATTKFDERIGEVGEQFEEEKSGFGRMIDAVQDLGGPFLQSVATQSVLPLAGGIAQSVSRRFATPTPLNQQISMSQPNTQSPGRR
jgi:hypothetical protein